MKPTPCPPAPPSGAAAGELDRRAVRMRRWNALPAGEAESLLELLRVHCATEERMAKESGLVFTEHARKHKNMLAAITKAIKEVQEGKIDVFSVLRYVEYWFERHITEEDLNLARNLQQFSSGMVETEHAFTHARNSTPPPPLLS